MLLFCLLLVIPSKVVAQTPFAFIENGNQWPSKVIARADIEGGRIYLEKDRMTIHLMQSEESGDFHHHFPNKHHVYQIVFEGAQSPTVKKNQVLGGKHNFILGNDKNKWSSNLSAYATLTLENLYPNIDFKIYTRNGRLKYDFVVHPGGDASLIKLRYDFTKGIALNKFTQNLEVNTRFGSGIESQPIYYIDGSDNKLEGNYIVNNNLVSFKVPEYDKDRSTLIIDPILEFASYTGSTSNNFGYTAAPDGEGFLYSGSTVFAQGYPTTTGAFDETYNDGPGSLVDIGLSKWDTTGSKLIWSTYIGGNESEIPHSLFVNDNH